VLFIRGTAFKEHAENIAESLSIGSEVLITGRLKTDQWQDKTSGGKRLSMVLDRSVSALPQPHQILVPSQRAAVG
jgi:single-stranded DNA-binding protein